MCFGGSSYRKAAQIEAEALRKASEIQTAQADRTLAFQKAQYKAAMELEKPWRDAGVRAIAKMEGKIASYGRQERQALATLNELDDFTDVDGELVSFEDWAEKRGRTGDTDVTTAFEHVMDFKKSVADGVWRGDPGYDFRLREGARVLKRDQARTGRRLSAAGARALVDYGQEAASDEYARAHARSVTEGQLRESGDVGRRSRVLEDYAIDQEHELGAYRRDVGERELRNQNILTRFEAGNTLRGREYGRLRELAGYGSSGAARTTQLGQHYSDNIADTMTGRGDVAAAGIAGAGRAKAQGLVNRAEANRAFLSDVIGAGATIAGAHIGARGR